MLAAVAALADYRAGAVLLMIMLPIEGVWFFPHSMFGLTGLNPLNALLGATLVSFVLRGKGLQEVPSKDCVIIAMPGGGGLGNPRKRPAAVVAEDVRQGFISSEAARRDYGVAVNDDGSVDEAETAKLRAIAAE